MQQMQPRHLLTDTHTGNLCGPKFPVLRCIQSGDLNPAAEHEWDPAKCLRALREHRRGRRAIRNVEMPGEIDGAKIGRSSLDSSYPSTEAKKDKGHKGEQPRPRAAPLRPERPTHILLLPIHQGMAER